MSGNIDWLSWIFAPDGPGISWFFSWPVLFANLLFFGIKPVLFVVFFCRYAGIPLRRSFPALYLPLFALSYFVNMFAGLTGFPGLLPEVLLLTLCGHYFCRNALFPSWDLSFMTENEIPRCKHSTWSIADGNKKILWLQALSISTLILTVNYVCHGILQLFFFWLLVHIPPSWTLVFTSSDAIQALFQNLLLIFSLLLIQKYFYPDLRKGNSLIFAVLTVPLFYISLVERTIQDSFYGNTIIFQSDLGICFPVVNHAQVLFLQLFSYLCLLLTLIACQSVQKALYHQQMLQILEQQRQAQENYMQETRLRYEQTCAFRHDIRNHLSVLAELLSQKDMEHARQYLSDLGQIASRLSVPVSTGNASVDALLGNKMTLARQAGISVSCQLKIPPSSPVKDIDWCILLANALDNAIKANESLPAHQRRLFLGGTQKGNFFLLTIENSCHKDSSRIPSPGIGLSNIQAVMEKYQGQMEIALDEDIFRLQLLFCF